MNPALRLAIRNVKVQRVCNKFVLVTYEEWQRNAVASTPPNNARIATVLFEKKKDKLDWLHIHETWMPGEIAAKGSYVVYVITDLW
ncbi:MAG: hypothetical protein A6F71_08685 [Cycloclasticus sp. symbiont of Poecilosclerida sp. M]|nr:MAG: hypothetical protein A6F71_08685 [Cycloclasticus sp. symbiont of Poecilosclerida sp. M]